MLVYPSGTDMSSSSLRLLSARLRAHRRQRGTRWRRLNAGRQALLALAHLRCGHTYGQLAAGSGIGTITAYRYVTDAVELLAALAPDLATAMKTATQKAFAILDGTLLPIDRITADRPFYSGNHKRHGMNVQVLADPHGRLLWPSPAPSMTSGRPPPTASSTHLPTRACPAGRTRATRAPAVPSACPSAADGTGSPQVSRPSTAPMRASGPWASKPWPL